MKAADSRALLATSERMARATTACGAGTRAARATDLDLAVARGAAYYGQVRSGNGVRIRGGTARTYYIGIESAMPAVPGLGRR